MLNLVFLVEAQELAIREEFVPLVNATSALAYHPLIEFDLKRLVWMLVCGSNPPRTVYQHVAASWHQIVF